MNNKMKNTSKTSRTDANVDPETGSTKPDKKTRSKRPICPSCGHADEVIPILYGEPTAESMRKAEKGLLWIGGCVIVNTMPRFHCRKHDIDF